MKPAPDDVPTPFRGRPPVFHDATELECVGKDAHGRDALLHPAAASAWREMARESSRCGVTLLIVSAFRSIERQSEIVRGKRSKGLSWDEILRVSAYPGFSEHHTGCAVDIGAPECCDLVEEFEFTKEPVWIRAVLSQR
jgi:zinc D-Ala-D-Ala carboxypeptidase